MLLTIRIVLNNTYNRKLSTFATRKETPTLRFSKTNCKRSTQALVVIVIVISKLLKRYSKAKRTRAPAYSRALRRIKGGFPKGVKRSSGPNSRVPGGDRVAVR